MFEKIFSGTKYLEKGIDSAVLRNQVIQNNIANAETPNFKSSSVEFETIFQNALANNMSDFKTKRTRDKHIDFSESLDGVDGVVVSNDITTHRMDGNNVDIDFQNVQLARNQLYYDALIEKMNSEFRRLKMAIREGG